MTKARLILLILFFTFFYCKPTGADELSAEILDRLKEIHASISSVSGSFIQEKHLAMFEQNLISRGSFAIANPRKIYWAYNYPMKFGFSSDGETIRRWREGSGESKNAPLAHDPVLSVVTNQMLAWATMDTKVLKRDFDITVIESSPLSLKLIPVQKQLSDIIRSVTLIFDDQERHISSITLLEDDKDKTVIRFEKVRLNQDLPDGLF